MSIPAVLATSERLPARTPQQQPLHCAQQRKLVSLMAYQQSPLVASSGRSSAHVLAVAACNPVASPCQRSHGPCGETPRPLTCVVWPTVTCTRPRDGSAPAWNRIFSTAAMAARKVGTLPGAQARPRSMQPASKPATHTPTRSPWPPSSRHTLHVMWQERTCESAACRPAHAPWPPCIRHTLHIIQQERTCKSAAYRPAHAPWPPCIRHTLHIIWQERICRPAAYRPARAPWPSSIRQVV